MSSHHHGLLTVAVALSLVLAGCGGLTGSESPDTSTTTPSTATAEQTQTPTRTPPGYLEELPIQPQRYQYTVENDTTLLATHNYTIGVRNQSKAGISISSRIGGDEKFRTIKSYTVPYKSVGSQVSTAPFNVLRIGVVVTEGRELAVGNTWKSDGETPIPEGTTITVTNQTTRSGVDVYAIKPESSEIDATWYVAANGEYLFAIAYENPRRTIELSKRIK